MDQDQPEPADESDRGRSQPASEPALPAGQAPAVGVRRRSRLVGPVLLGAIVLVLGVGAVAVVALRRNPQSTATAQLRPAGIPASISTPLATLMQLSPVQSRTAPGFRLTDQLGRVVSLSQFRGKAVVLEFMDPHCVDICPIVSQEFVDAHHDLGSNAGGVVFLAINVNQYFATPSDMLRFSRDHGLEAISSWHFVTGPTPALKRVWTSYGVLVEAPNPNADIIHTSIVYFIAPDGTERFVAAPMADHRSNGAAFLPLDQVAAWGHGIALLAAQLVH